MEQTQAMKKGKAAQKNAAGALTSEQLTARMKIVGKIALAVDALGIFILGKSLIWTVSSYMKGRGDISLHIPLAAYHLTTVFMFAMCVLLLPVLLRLSQSGLPYKEQNVRLLRITAILMGASAVLPALIGAVDYLICATDVPFGLIRMRNSLFILILDSQGFFIGICLMLLFVREIVHYGWMLQQESDETL